MQDAAKHQKVAAIIWTIDPTGQKRFLLRHNKPFDGHEDEWTIIFGDIEPGEAPEIAARREAHEECGVQVVTSIRDLQYAIEYTGKHGPTVIHFFALQAESINVPVVLNEESIGYDWVILQRARELMQHEDEFKALELAAGFIP